VMPAVNSASESWTTTFFARPYDLKAGTIKDRLCAARPTIFLGVPLVWEKIADKMRAVGASVTGLKKSISTWAKDKALRKGREGQLGGTGEVPWGTTVSLKILHKAKEALGLDQVKFGFTGAAPIRVDTLEYFASIGIQINELYGMSECTGACTFSLNEAHQWGSCGWEIPGIEVRVFKVDPTDMNKKTECPKSSGLDASDEAYMGEICWRGRGNMMGYMAQADLGAAHVAEIEKKTGEAIDCDGWLHSGDKGMITDKGMVKITGRYKELIIGDGGENIAPVPIEDSVKKLCDGICEIMMIGDKRKYNVALVTLKAVGANGEVPGTDNLDAGAKHVNPEVQTISGAMDDKVWIDIITKAIAETNKNPKVCINNAFTIQKFTILPTNFSEERSHLTPTKKLKRAVVEKEYKALIDKMYAPEGKGAYVRYSE
jgi:long-chain-fatty-acid--CoA ligase ACSBG